MHRYSGWAEISTGRPAPAQVERVRLLVAAQRASGVAVGLTEAGGRWHVWAEGTTRDGPPPLLPLFKAIGAVAAGSVGVLEVERVDTGGTRADRWVLMRGSVTAAEQSWDRVSL